MIRYVMALAVALALVGGGGNPAIASHETFTFVLPHEVAIALDTFDLRQMGPATPYTKPGCDMIVTYPLEGVTGEDRVAGYAVHAVSDSWVNRLLRIELFNLDTQEDLFSWANTDDYDILVKCHSKDNSGISI